MTMAFRAVSGFLQAVLEEIIDIMNRNHRPRVVYDSLPDPNTEPFILPEPESPILSPVSYLPANSNDAEHDDYDQDVVRAVEEGITGLTASDVEHEHDHAAENLRIDTDSGTNSNLIQSSADDSPSSTRTGEEDTHAANNDSADSTGSPSTAPSQEGTEAFSTPAKQDEPQGMGPKKIRPPLKRFLKEFWGQEDRKQLDAGEMKCILEVDAAARAEASNSQEYGSQQAQANEQEQTEEAGCIIPTSIVRENSADHRSGLAASTTDSPSPSDRRSTRERSTRDLNLSKLTITDKDTITTISSDPNNTRAPPLPTISVGQSSQAQVAPPPPTVQPWVSNSTRHNKENNPPCPHCARNYEEHRSHMALPEEE
ncbi:hypothetical protein BDZ45DRAFT_489484 [Acephala macrosclerotiorum]|nr:hypothetical protein BDZ45DRAFT_489484 [Acephala macrosclerotiorum]